MPALTEVPVPMPAAAPVAPEAPAPTAPAGLQTPFDAIADGRLPGLQLPPIQKGAAGLDPMQDYVVTNMETILAAGIDYTDLPDDTTVLYNPEKVTTEAISAAYKDGTLDKLVPTAAAFQEFAQSQSAAPAGAPVADIPVPTAAPMPGPAGSTPPGVNRARLANVVPPKPISPNPLPDRLARRAV